MSDLGTRCIHCNQTIVCDHLDTWLHLTASGEECENLDTRATPPYGAVTDAYWNAPASDVPDEIEDTDDVIRLVRGLSQCNVCGAVVSDRKVHADWHGRRP